MSSITISSERQMRATTLVTEASTLALVMVAVSDSSENQETRIPASMTAWPTASAKWLLPVPLGPHSARFSARPTRQGHQGLLGGPGNGGTLRMPALEGLAGGEAGGPPVD